MAAWIPPAKAGGNHGSAEADRRTPTGESRPAPNSVSRITQARKATRSSADFSRPGCAPSGGLRAGRPCSRSKQNELSCLRSGRPCSRCKKKEHSCLRSGRPSAGRRLPPVSTGGGRATLICLSSPLALAGFSRSCARRKKNELSCLCSGWSSAGQHLPPVSTGGARATLIRLSSPLASAGFSRTCSQREAQGDCPSARPSPRGGEETAGPFLVPCFRAPLTLAPRPTTTFLSPPRPPWPAAAGPETRV